jgi:hypothetical protein
MRGKCSPWFEGCHNPNETEIQGEIVAELQSSWPNIALVVSQMDLVGGRQTPALVWVKARVDRTVGGESLTVAKVAGSNLRLNSIDMVAGSSNRT